MLESDEGGAVNDWRSADLSGDVSVGHDPVNQTNFADGDVLIFGAESNFLADVGGAVAEDGAPGDGELRGVVMQLNGDFFSGNSFGKF